MKIAMFQMDIIPGSPEKNRQKIKDWVQETVNTENPDVLVLPEMWTTAYTLQSLSELADDENDDQTLSFLQEVAKAHHVFLFGGSYAVRTKKGVVNRAPVISDTGDVVELYDKIHLVPMLNEPDYLISGEKRPSPITYKEMKAMVGICYDLRFPELFRPLAAEGANLLTIPAEWPAARGDHWETLLKARAIENDIFVAACNRCGEYNGTEFAGRSMIIDPLGNIIEKSSPDKEETLIATVDFALADETRKNIPVFESRDTSKYIL